VRSSGFALWGRRVEGFKGSLAGNYLTNSHPLKLNAKAQRESAGPFL